MSVIRIPEFYGIQQQKDGTLLNVGTARNAVNMETGDGCLTVAEAFRTIVNRPATESGEEWRALFAFERSTGDDLLVACSSRKIVFCTTDYSAAVSWQELISASTTPQYTPADRDSAFDAQLARIGSTDYILIATGGTQIIKAPINELIAGNPVWSWFGSGTYYLPAPITITGVDTTTITKSVISLSGDMLSASTHPDERLRALVFGVYIMDGTEVKYLLFPDLIDGIASDGSTITLDLTGCTVTTSNTVQLRGGVSDKPVSSLELYHDRLWSAGDPEHLSRLYWSCVAGEGRTIEDWVSDDYDEDASGGHVDVGTADGDKIVALKSMTDCLLIFKVNSIWRLYGNRPSNYTLERITDEIGAYDDSEIITRYGTPYWLTKNGIFYCDGTNAMSADNDVDYLHDLFWEVNGAARRSACCVPALRKLFFDVRSDVFGRFILTRDLVTGAYLTFNGADIIDIATASDEALFLTAQGDVIARGENTSRLTPYLSADGLAAKWTSQRMDFGGLIGRKQISAFWFRATGGRMRVTVRTNIGSNTFDVVPDEMQTDVVRMPVSMSEARTVQVEIENVNGSRFRIEGGIYIVYTEKYDG